MLPSRQLEFYTFLKTYLEESEAHGKRPSEHEMAAAFGVSQPMVHKYLRELARKGLLYFGRYRPYGFVVRLNSGGPVRVVMAPLLGAFDKHGVVQQLTERLWEPVLIRADDEESTFMLAAVDDLPELGVLRGDFLVFSRGAGLLGGTVVALQGSTKVVRLLLPYVGATGAVPSDPEQQRDLLRVDSYSFAPRDLETGLWHAFRSFRSSSGGVVHPIFQELTAEGITVAGRYRRLIREVA